MTNYEKYGFCPFSKHLTDKDCHIMEFCIYCDTYFEGYNKAQKDTITKIKDFIAKTDVHTDYDYMGNGTDYISKWLLVDLIKDIERGE